MRMSRSISDSSTSRSGSERDGMGPRADDRRFVSRAHAGTAENRDPWASQPTALEQVEPAPHQQAAMPGGSSIVIVLVIAIPVLIIGAAFGVLAAAGGLVVASLGLALHPMFGPDGRPDDDQHMSNNAH